MTQAHTRDFTKKRMPVYFTIDDVRYNCYKALDLDQLRRFAQMAQSLSSFVKSVQNEDADVEDKLAESADAASAVVDKILDLMKIVMKKVSFAVFATKVSPTDADREDDDFEPIDPVQLMDIVQWLMGIYTKRPTQPSSISSDGSTSDDGGSSSTAGASPGESVPPSSPETTSSIS